MIEHNAILRLVGIRFSKVGKIYHFNVDHLEKVMVGDQVIVDTARGTQLGEVVQVIEREPNPGDGDIKPVNRIATPRDLLLRQMWKVKEADALDVCQKRAKEIRLHNLKFVSAEFSFDGARLTFLFTSETEEKIDMKSLRTDMQKIYENSQLEFRQIGPRDVAKILGGMGACGLETRCCSRFLMEFNSISIRMAKEQGISLSPTEITGMCGRLRCCLIYEFETYNEARKGLPKRGKRIVTPAGEGKVIDVQALQGVIRVEIPEVGIKQFTREELESFSREISSQRKELETFEPVKDEDLPTSAPVNSKPDANKPRTGFRPGKKRRPGNRS